jgi:DNA-directed RNA polymerase subunit N (RpoN/RPB10)
MSSDFRVTNMNNLKQILDAESASNQGRFMTEGIEGLKEQKRVLNLEEAEQRLAEDENERQTLSRLGIDTYNPRRTIRLTYNNPRGGKRSRRRKTRGKKRRSTKRRR